MKVATILGTRPEIIKLSPLIPLLEKEFEHFIIHTGQHYDYELDQVFFEELHLPTPKYNLHVGSGRQGKQTGIMLEKIEATLLEEKPDLVIVQGDTNTTLAGALAASKLHLPLAHVEAGCRNFNKQTPEEINRIVADHIAEYLFPADENSKENLLREGIPLEKIYFLGNNTIYDACLRNIKFAQKSTILKNLNLEPGNYLLATIHRAESTETKERLDHILQALNTLVPRIDVVLPLHPRTKKMIEQYDLILSPKIKIIPPLEYLDFLKLLSGCKFCLTDSGGVQDEAIVFNLPCLLPLKETCWPRLIEAGKNFLVGTTTESILAKVDELLNDEEKMERIKQIKSSFEWGVSEKIVATLKQEFVKRKIN